MYNEIQLEALYATPETQQGTDYQYKEGKYNFPSDRGEMMSQLQQ